MHTGSQDKSVYSVTIKHLQEVQCDSISRYLRRPTVTWPLHTLQAWHYVAESVGACDRGVKTTWKNCDVIHVKKNVTWLSVWGKMPVDILNILPQVWTCMHAFLWTVWLEQTASSTIGSCLKKTLRGMKYFCCLLAWWIDFILLVPNTCVLCLP